MENSEVAMSDPVVLPAMEVSEDTTEDMEMGTDMITDAEDITETAPNLALGDADEDTSVSVVGETIEIQDEATGTRSHLDTTVTSTVTVVSSPEHL